MVEWIGFGQNVGFFWCVVKLFDDHSCQIVPVARQLRCGSLCDAWVVPGLSAEAC